MQLYYFVALAAFVAAVSATSVSNLQRCITDPGNCPNLDNYPPDGGADTYNLEQPCSRIRLNYGTWHISEGILQFVNALNSTVIVESKACDRGANFFENSNKRSCDICLEPFEWDFTQRSPHIIDCGHVFCAECLHQVFPTKCPLCRKLYLPSEIRKLHVECRSDDDKEEVDLLKELITAYDSSEEDILRLRIRVDSWLSSRTLNEHSPLRRARDALEQYQQLKQKRFQDRRKIKTLERAARQWEKSVQDSATRKEAEAAIMEQTLRSQLAEHQAQITQLRAEIDKKQAQLDRSKLKKSTPKPLPLPQVLTPISNPLPTPPRLVRVTTNKSTWPVDHKTRSNTMPPPRFPILERDDGFDGLEDNAAYFTCRTAPYAWLDDEEFGDESSLQRPIKNAHC
ncbi:protein lysine methyltransferase [Lentinula edodes]|uniref:Protein lysine methyltransferase n=1 Tax=Lentinula edodes TaxID=5353 RepID=A0A1Q3EPC8_LENED|nr:protein lysine methyltransferase [Lentinula edodes]